MSGIVFIMGLIFAASSPEAQPVKLELTFSDGTTPVLLDLKEGNLSGTYLDLGQNLIKLRVFGLGNVRVFQQTETSLTIMNEGPHLDLTKWRHGLSPKEMMMEQEGYFLFNPKQPSTFPPTTPAEIVKAAREFGDKSWAQEAQKCPSVNEGSCQVAPSTYKFKIEVEENGSWKPWAQAQLYPAMGC